ncbi:hypothetical protein [Bradyrhizobium sp. AUGA SZCCT0182]|uniref:hypothetical protein n=1 Tax=Bradyrhizobium sp. AUGA SZCCT0182 TaxID=2807667 RepID=UPI001BA662C2|nr:hypothetical protein [Bradyrhizobium sp. AUGA SZCCT0182]MBR1232856.1 hypothetical protein [Bradyrhizobium sp. AUGA SZCCT0182]
MRPVSKPTLLGSESEREYLALREGIAKEIKPKGQIEWMFLDDILEILWEILRLRRYRTLIICNTIPAAVQSLLKQLTFEPDFITNTQVEADAIAMAKAYFQDAKAKKKFMEILGRVGFDERALEAEAFRLAMSDLERLDKMLSALERRRNKALRFIAEYRRSLATQIQRVTDRIIAEVDGPSLEPSTSPEHAD